MTTNLYKSVVTNDVTLPVTSDPPTRFDQLFGNEFTVYSTQLVESKPIRAPLSISFLSWRSTQNEFEDVLFHENWKRKPYKGNSEKNSQKPS